MTRQLAVRTQGCGRRVGRALGVFLLVGLSLAGCRGSSGTDGSDQATPKPAPSGPTASAGEVRRSGFDDGTAVPSGSEVFSGSWLVRADNGTSSPPNALCQTATATFPAIALTAQNYFDGTVTVRFKAISGKEDQAAGIAFRILDRDNYYILRANALEGNVSFYEHVDGKRSLLLENSVKITVGTWYELKVQFEQDTMTAFLDGAQIVTTTDNTLPGGRVGLWTKADSTTCFDDFTATAR